MVSSILEVIIKSTQGQFRFDLHMTFRIRLTCFQIFTNETVQKAYLATEENPFDLDAWNILLREMQQRKIEEMRSLFEKLVKMFPTTGRFWKMYIEQEVGKAIFV